MQLENDKSDIITSIEFNKESFSTYNVTLDYFETVTTNPTTFLNDVSDGQVTLKLLGQKFDLDLHEVKIVSDDAKIIAEDGSISDAPKAYSYQGVVVGKPNSSVALTVGDDVLIGEIKIGNKIYTIDQTSKKYNNKVVHLVYSSDAMKKRKILEYNTDTVSGDQNVSRDQIALQTSSLNQTQITDMLLSVPTVDVMACYDSEFVSAFSNPSNEIQRIFNGISSAYSPASVNFNIKTYRSYSISNGASSDVQSRFKTAASSDRDSTSSDIAFLFSGKEMTGDSIGTSDVYTGSSSQAYGVAQMVSGGLLSSYQATPTERVILTTHEIGHIFGATHEEAYEWWNNYVYHYYTAMWTPFKGTSYPNYMQNEFSNLNNHGDSNNNNILHIVASKSTIAGFQ